VGFLRGSLLAWQLAPDAGPDVAQQPLIASERSLEGLAANARANVAADGGRSGDDVGDLAGVLIDQFEFAPSSPRLAHQCRRAARARTCQRPVLATG
jgi:hypothetical protein